MIRYYPLTGVAKTIVGGYGNRVYNGVAKLHDAVDLGAPTGTPVVAVDDGTVKYAVDPTGGNVAILHSDDGTSVAYYMAHLLRAQSGSRKVKAGEQIAECDTTGNAALVGIPHVHFQVWPGGTFQQGTVHPDPTAQLLAAPILNAPLGRRGIGSYVAYAFGFATLVGVSYAGFYAWDRRDRWLT